MFAAGNDCQQENRLDERFGRLDICEKKIQ